MLMALAAKTKGLLQPSSLSSVAASTPNNVHMQINNYIECMHACLIAVGLLISDFQTSKQLS